METTGCCAVSLHCSPASKNTIGIPSHRPPREKARLMGGVQAASPLLEVAVWEGLWPWVHLCPTQVPKPERVLGSFKRFQNFKMSKEIVPSLEIKLKTSPKSGKCLRLQLQCVSMVLDRQCSSPTHSLSWIEHSKINNGYQHVVDKECKICLNLGLIRLKNNNKSGSSQWKIQDPLLCYPTGLWGVETLGSFQTGAFPRARPHHRTFGGETTH